MTAHPAPVRAPARPPGGPRRLIRPATRRGRVARAVVLPLVALLVLTLVAEVAARHVLDSRFARGMAKALGGRVTVDTGGSPALLDIVDHHLDHVTLSADNARLGPLTGGRIRLTLNGVHLGRPAPTASSVQADITIPVSALAGAIGGSGQGVPVSDARTDPANGTLLLGLGPGGMGELTLKPVLTGGRVTITATGLQFLGRSVGGSQLAQINARLAARKQPAHYPLSLKPTSLTVTRTGLDLVLSSGRTTLKGTRD